MSSTKVYLSLVGVFNECLLIDSGPPFYISTEANTLYPSNKMPRSTAGNKDKLSNRNYLEPIFKYVLLNYLDTNLLSLSSKIYEDIP